MTRYLLSNAALLRSHTVAVVGCGGTGGFVAEGLCRLLLALNRPDVQLVLVDPDRVEERNVLRQNFLPQEVGRFKAAALAERLASHYGRPVGYRLELFSAGRQWEVTAGLLIGCVDNAPARAELAKAVRPRAWWIDSGNGLDFGQVLVGNAEAKDLQGAFDEQAGICHAYPTPMLQAPELLELPQPAELDPNCADAVLQGDQSPVVNHLMASVVLETVRRLFLGSLSWVRVDVDLATMRLQARDATPEHAARVVGLRPAQLVKKGGERA